jgi:hypothetical protein
MAREELIKIRVTKELKERLLAQAVKRDKTLSDYVRDRLYEHLEVAEEQAPYGHTTPAKNIRSHLGEKLRKAAKESAVASRSPRR